MINVDAIKDKKILFVCMLGQVRSRFLAEQFNRFGIIANFCGYDDDADIKLNLALVRSYDVIVIIDRNFPKWSPYLSESDKIIRHHLDVIPTEYWKEMESIINKIIEVNSK